MSIRPVGLVIKISSLREACMKQKTIISISGEEDRVRCFMCDGALAHWDKKDVPLYEHYRWFGNCQYIKECHKNPVAAAIIDTAKQIHVSFV